MPCAVTQAEIEYYEKQSNKENYGIEEVDSRITETVCCLVSKKLKELGEMEKMPEFVQKWFKEHLKEDELRNEK